MMNPFRHLDVNPPQQQKQKTTTRKLPNKQPISVEVPVLAIWTQQDYFLLIMLESLGCISVLTRYHEKALEGDGVKQAGGE